MKQRLFCILMMLSICLTLTACGGGGEDVDTTTASAPADVQTDPPQEAEMTEEERLFAMLSGVVSYGELMGAYDFELVNVANDLEEDPLVYYGQKDGISHIRRQSGKEEFVFVRDDVQYAYSLKDGVATPEDHVFLSEIGSDELTTSGLEITVTGTGLYLYHADMPQLLPEEIVSTVKNNGGKVLTVGTDYFARFARVLCEAQGMTATEVEDVLASLSMELVYDVAKHRIEVQGSWSAKHIYYEESDYGSHMRNPVTIDKELSGVIELTEDGRGMERVTIEMTETDGEAVVISTIEIDEIVLEEGVITACRTESEEKFTCRVTHGNYSDRLTYDVTATVNTETVLTLAEDTVMTQVTKQNTKLELVGKHATIHANETLTTKVTRTSADTFDFRMEYEKGGVSDKKQLTATLRTPSSTMTAQLPAAIEQAVTEANAPGGEVARDRWEREAVEIMLDYFNEKYPAAPIWFSQFVAIEPEDGGEVLMITIDQTRTTPGDYCFLEYITEPNQGKDVYALNRIPFYRLQGGEPQLIWEPAYMPYIDTLSRSFLASPYATAETKFFYVVDETAQYYTMINWYGDHFDLLDCYTFAEFSPENFMASEESMPPELKRTRLEAKNGVLS